MLALDAATGSKDTANLGRIPAGKTLGFSSSLTAFPARAAWSAAPATFGRTDNVVNPKWVFYTLPT
jgi:hypothetical protein